MQEFSMIDITGTGKKISSLRKDAGMSVKNLKEVLCGGSQQAIYKWERGEGLPSVDNLVMLSEIFHVTVDDIIVKKRSNEK